MKEGRGRTVDGPEEKKAHTERPDPPASPAQMSTHQRKAAAAAKAKATKPRARAKAMPRYSFDQFAYMTSSYLVLMYCLQKMKLISNHCICGKCHNTCTTIKSRDMGTKTNGLPRDPFLFWTCSCDTKAPWTQSVRHGSIWEDKVAPQDFVRFVYLELYRTPQGSMREMFGICPDKARSMRVVMQELMATMNRYNLVKLGGGKDGNAAEIDATYTGHLRTVKTSWGGVYRGTVRTDKHGLIVIIERNSRRVVIESCGPDENAKDIDRIARENIEEGTTVFSDAGAAMRHVGDVVNGEHFTVRHNKHFVDPITKVHSNTVEGRNAHIKKFLKAQGYSFAKNEDCLWGNLAHYIWQQWSSNGSGTMQFGMFFLAMFDQAGFC